MRGTKNCCEHRPVATYTSYLGWHLLRTTRPLRNLIEGRPCQTISPGYTKYGIHILLSGGQFSRVLRIPAAWSSLVDAHVADLDGGSDGSSGPTYVRPHVVLDLSRAQLLVLHDRSRCQPHVVLVAVYLLVRSRRARNRTIQSSKATAPAQALQSP